MASIFHQKYTDKDKNGKTVRRQSKFWYVDYRTADGTRKRIKGYRDKAATVQLAAKLEREAELAHAGVVDKYVEHRKKPLKSHLEDFRASLLNKGTTVKQAKQAYNRAKAIIDHCRFTFMADISASRVQAYLADRRREGLSIRTSNFYLQAMKQFCHWLVADGRAGENPLAYLKGQNPKTDIRRRRRTLTSEEFKHLIQTTTESPKHHKMMGKERAMLYLLGTYSGFRAGELASLCWEAFDMDEATPTVTVQAGYSKRRRDDVQPIRPDVAEQFMRWKEEQQTSDGDKVFGNFNKSKGAEILRRDLEAAGIPYEDAQGRVVDFHSLRHTFITNLVDGGATPKVAQQLARHSTINLTMDTYTHLQLHDERAALEGMSVPPDVNGKGNEIDKVAKLKTGTDDTPIDTSDGAYKPAYKKLAKNAYSDSHKLARTGNWKKDTSCENTQSRPDDNSLQKGNLITNKHNMSPADVPLKSPAPDRTRTCDLRFRKPSLYPG